MIGQFACKEHGRMVRTADLKYITYHNDPTEQLFDMRHDPGETRNLAFDTACGETLASMRQLLEKYENSLQKVEPIKLS
jgi:arylsulfatase A-like enzyme